MGVCTSKANRRSKKNTQKQENRSSRKVIDNNVDQEKGLMSNNEEQQHPMITEEEIDDSAQYINCTSSEILKSETIKKNTFTICAEIEAINKSGTDKGLIIFFDKYLNQKNINDIFNKCDVDDGIEEPDDLINVLRVCILLYKVKVFQTKNTDSDKARVEKTRIQKKELNPIATYLAFWILENYGTKILDDNGEDTYDITITKESFADNMKTFLTAFIDITHH